MGIDVLSDCHLFINLTVSNKSLIWFGEVNEHNVKAFEIVLLASCLFYKNILNNDTTSWIFLTLFVKIVCHLVELHFP